MAYTLLSQSYGTVNALATAAITEVGTGLPATLLSSASGGFINNTGKIQLDSSGNLSVYVDGAKTWQVSLDDGSVAASQVVSQVRYIAASDISGFIGQTGITYIVNTAPFDRYIWNGTSLVVQPTVSSSGVIIGSGGAPVSGGGEDARWKSAQNRRRSFKLLGGYQQAGGTGYTYQIATTAEARFLAVRLVLMNVQAAAITVSCCVAASNTPVGNNPTGAWVQATKGGSASIVLPAGDGTRRPSVTVTDWINVASVDRADGSALPIIFARLYSASQVYVLGNTSSLDGSEWSVTNGAIAQGRVAIDFAASGDFVTANQASFVGTSTYGSAITGFEFLHTTDVMTGLALGDSIAQGDGGNAAKLLGPAIRAILASSSTAKPVQYANYGWSSDKTSGFVQRLDDLLSAGIRPNVVIMTAWSTNDLTTSSVAFFSYSLTLMRDNALAVKGLCDRYGIKLVLTNAIPYVYAENRDSIRRAYNIEIAAFAAKAGIQLIDYDSAITSGTTPATIVAGATDDNLHPNDIGNALLTPAVLPVVVGVRDEFFG